MIIKIIRRIFGLSSPFLLAACTTLTTPPICDDFQGIGTSFDHQNTVSLLIVHGMSGYSDSDPCSLIKGIARELCLCPEGESCDRQITREKPYKWYGCLSRQDYCGIGCPDHLKIYVLDWRPATWNEKSIIRYIDEKPQASCRRLDFIDKLKRDFVNSGLGDLALYMGSFGDEIRYPFEQAIRWIHQDSIQDPKHEVVVVTFSMGGQMLLDTLERMRNSNSYATKVRESFIGKTRAFFMLSNQVPLLELSKLPSPPNSYPYKDNAICDLCNDCCPSAPLTEPEEPFQIDWSETSVGHFIDEKRKTLSGFRIVSFSDPNDILSYSFYACECPGLCSDYFIDAGALNVKRAYFGLINPAKAHQRYGQNRKIIKMIAHGVECQ